MENTISLNGYANILKTFNLHLQFSEIKFYPAKIIRYILQSRYDESS